MSNTLWSSALYIVLKLACRPWREQPRPRIRTKVGWGQSLRVVCSTYRSSCELNLKDLWMADGVVSQGGPHPPFFIKDDDLVLVLFHKKEQSAPFQTIILWQLTAFFLGPCFCYYICNASAFGLWCSARLWRNYCTHLMHHASCAASNKTPPISHSIIGLVQGIS